MRMRGSPTSHGLSQVSEHPRQEACHEHAGEGGGDDLVKDVSHVCKPLMRA